MKTWELWCLLVLLVILYGIIAKACDSKENIDQVTQNKEINYYYFSNEQKEILQNIFWDMEGKLMTNRFKNFAEIDGKIVEYTSAFEKPLDELLFNDMIYLGKGIYHHSEKD